MRQEDLCSFLLQLLIITQRLYEGWIFQVQKHPSSTHIQQEKEEMTQSSATAKGDGPSPKTGHGPQQPGLRQTEQPLVALVISKPGDTPAAHGGSTRDPYFF